MDKRPYGNFLIDDKLNFLKFSSSANEPYSIVESLFSYRLLIKPILNLFMVHSTTKENIWVLNSFNICRLVTILLSFILLPVIAIELAIHTLFLMLAIFIDFIFSNGSFCVRYLDWKDCFSYIFKNIIFQIAFWNFILKSDSMASFINVISIAIVIYSVLAYVKYYFNFLVTNNDDGEHYGLLLRDFYIVHFWGNYYYSISVTETLVKSYNNIVKLAVEEREYFDKIFNLFKQNVNVNHGIEKDLESLGKKLLNYARNSNTFKEYMDGLIQKTEIMCNLGDYRRINEVIGRIGVERTREYINDLQVYMKDCLDEYYGLYNKLFMKLIVRLL